MQWNLEQIRLFVSVAERQSFSAAARELKRVQSAVSNGIALLEADLGVTLFERSGRQPRLTDEGPGAAGGGAQVLRQCERLGARWAWRAARSRGCAWPRTRRCLTSRCWTAWKRWRSAFPVWRCRCPAAAR